jgi:hypothetical protein
MTGDAEVDVAFADEGGYVSRGEEDADCFRLLVLFIDTAVIMQG